MSAGSEVDELGRLGQFQVAPDLLLDLGGLGTLCDGAFAGSQRDQVEPVEFVAQGAPGLAGGGLGDADQQ